MLCFIVSIETSKLHMLAKWLRFVFHPLPLSVIKR